MSTHIESKLEDISSVVLMPGDPKRCELPQFVGNKLHQT